MTAKPRSAEAKGETVPPVAASADALRLRAALRDEGLAPVGSLAFGDLEVALGTGADALWAIVRRPGRGGLALRAAHAPAGCRAVRLREDAETGTVSVTFDSLIGSQRVDLSVRAGELPVLRVTTTLTPAVPLRLPFLPRDLYPLGEGDDPFAAGGRVEAAQRGLNGGVCFFRLDEPAFGTVLYFQNLTALNPYFEATGTTPDGVVGGEWPELGLLLPTREPQGRAPCRPLAAGEPVILSDALLAVHEDPDGDEQVQARRYLSLLGSIYRCIEAPAPEYHDWVGRAEGALRDLDRSPKATIDHYGFRYVHPYTASEYPDSMVQLATVAALRDYEAWKREPVPLRKAFAAGLRKFYDRRLETLRRYLPNVGDDKDKDAVDSWYLYHPLMNLGRLALDDDARAKRLFLQSIGFGIKAARHFDYRWPIQYKVTDFSIIEAARDDEGLGQTDVGGLYAYVMLQAFELTGEQRYVDEARRAIDAAKGMRFELNYQANLTAWGAAACMRLWRITNDEAHLRQSYVYLASFFHNVALWESAIGHARHYRNFLGATALHDAPYMALYECFDSFAAFERYLKDSGPDLDPSARLLLCEYCRYALDRAWFYYPDALPADAIAGEQRNGHIDRALSFPVEDLYVDGQPAGQVGQEIYGAGAAFVYASRSFHTVRDAPFRLFCDHFLLASDRPAERSLIFQLGGGEGRTADLSLIRIGKPPLPEVLVTTIAGDSCEAHLRTADRIAFRVPADGRIALSW